METKEALYLLNKHFNHSIKDPVWGDIPLTKELKEILNVNDVKKLNRIKQNGPAYLIYPGAVHTRLSHSLGVYHLGRKILISLSKESDDVPFSKVGIFSFLISCLLHDIGHFPYAHSLKELPLKEHEELATVIINGNEELKEKIAQSGGSSEIVSMIIDKSLKTNDQEIMLYRDILSGPLDPDKLDYLTRDGFFAGISYGKQESDYILSAISLNSYSLVLEEDAKSNLEQILFSKYMMYKTLYWHKGVRSATSMIKKALLKALKDKSIKYEELYFLDDDEFNILCKERESLTPELELVERVEKGRLLEKKWEKTYQENGKLESLISPILSRNDYEESIFKYLSKKYNNLKSYEIILDIPEPISFETNIKLKCNNGKIRNLEKGDLIFSESVSKEFQQNLRKISLFLPSYISEEDAKMAMENLII